MLYLSSKILNTAPTSDDYLSPIQKGDLLELPGGRSVAISGIGAVSGASVSVSFDLFENFNVASGVNVNRFPAAGVSPSAGSEVKYSIKRSPVPSTSKILTLPRGMAIDFNYSGIGLGGSQFAPSTNSAITPRSVDLMFNSDGAVTQVIYNTANDRLYPTGMIFFCIGEIDSIASVEGATAADRENLFSADSKLTTNVMSSDSLWLVVNPGSGQVTTVANASVGTIPSDPTDPTATGFGAAMQDARLFTTYSDTVSQ
ncbi:hypothetical protein [Aporhodopirellula aestuarii]|uniref:Uncharacterized protein n=1 Tax=Aporhodopirellula aestuarii TaxID=2950107 RepID=A0ABT0U5B7_9BACT|nr:hypothetical protein [Aporhodopirellula aestuarii]MCM2371755.1 hypothetical protein [Aporhodopirellula aestuarii]